jgi:hypothetical protein
MVSGNGRKHGKYRLSPGLKKELERDVREIESILDELLKKFAGRIFETGIPGRAGTGESSMDFFMKYLEHAKEGYALSILEFAALSHCIRALAGNFGGLIGDDIMIFQKAKLGFVRVLNDSSRTIRRLRGGEAKSFEDIITIFEESFAKADGSKVPDLPAGMTGFIKANIGSLKPDREKLQLVMERLIDTLVQFQLVIGIILKWSFLAEQEFMRQVESEVKNIKWGEIYRNFVTPVMEAAVNLKKMREKMG